MRSVNALFDPLCATKIEHKVSSLHHRSPEWVGKRNRMRLVAFITALFVLCFPGFSGLSQGYFLNGDAEATGAGCYAVTPNVAWQSGTIWYADQLNLSEPFALEFFMNFGSADATGADGMVFVLHTLGTNAIGVDGNGMGFGGFDPSFGIEFDTFANVNPNVPSDNSNDPPFDHIAFLRDGIVDHATANNLAGPIQASSGNANIEDNQSHEVKITWDPATQTVRCYFDCVLRLTDQIDLIGSIFQGDNTVTWGFTGSTGFYFNAQSVCLSDYILETEVPSPICPGGSVELAAAGPENGDYNWSPSAGLDDPSSQTPLASPDATTEYTVTYTDLCGATQTSTVIVEVSDPYSIEPIVPITLCENETGQLSAVVTGQNPTYTWTTSGGSISGPANQASVQVTGPGSYTVTVASPQGCTSSTSTTVSSTLLPNWFIPDASYAICAGDELTLNAGGNVWSTLWNPGNISNDFFVITQPNEYSVTYTLGGCVETYPFQVTQNTLSANDLGPDQTICEMESVVLNAGVAVNWTTGQTAASITVNDSGTYGYTYSAGNCSTSDQVTISVDDYPVIDLGPDQEYCEGESITLTSQQSGQWSTGESGITITVSQPGNYGIAVVNGVCTATDAVQVTLLAPPVADLGPDLVYCHGREVTLTAIDPLNDTFLWSDGSTDATLAVTVSGVYSVTTGNSCGVAEDEIEIAFEECEYSIYIPNAFSPDNDGYNDAWRPEVRNLESYELFVFDRWGELIFHSTDPEEYWTGNAFGGDTYVPNGVYIYLVNFKAASMEAGERRGYILLMR
jgi:gliding motility-associated-like protein